jgi:uncharacterized protein
VIVVIDTNVLVSALHFALNRGKPRHTIEKAVREHTVAVCNPIEKEIQRILTAKFGWTTAEVEAAMAAVLPFPLRVEISGTLRTCRDPNDDVILECAVVAEAQIVVSGDKDLQVMHWYRGIQIVTPAQFLEMNL